MNRLVVGNDIVDLSLENTLTKFSDSRFINRVLSDEEKNYLLTSHCPETMLWILWSGKEAAYKALKKLLPDLIFSHSKIEVWPTDFKASSLPIKGIAKYRDHQIPLFWNSSKTWIHCLASINTRPRSAITPKINFAISTLDTVLQHNHVFSSDELISIFSKQSRGVRILAKSILNRYNLSDVEILRFPKGKKFTPPEIYQKGRLLPFWDLSMSHDGNYVSCAFSADDVMPLAC